jgi:pimeloyl-ACP methyl ester carboxylesterase
MCVDLLPHVRVPTLVLHSRHDNAVPYEERRRLAATIPNARFVTLESENHVPLPDEPAWPQFIAEIEAFLQEA